MQSTVIVALIGVIGVIFGACVTAGASTYAANQKIREIKLTYLQKSREDYLSNARLYTQEVYIPLSTQLSKLLQQYDVFRAHIDFNAQKVDGQYDNNFHAACEEYNREVSSLLQDRGASAFLTIELEEYLRSFSTFLKVSLTVTEPKIRIILESSYSIGVPLSLNYRGEIQGRIANFARYIPSLSINYVGVGFRYSKEIIAAPLTSREFEQYILDHERSIRFLIKEVTLGQAVNLTRTNDLFSI